MTTININLPKGDKDEAILTVSFKHGYLDENDKEFGIGHIVEHYLTDAIKKTYKPLDVYGEILDNYFSLYIYLDKNDVDRFRDEEKINTILKELSNNIDEDILNNEKGRIEIELEEKYTELFMDFSCNVDRKIIESPANLKRNPLDQIENIKNFDKNDIAVFINKLINIEKKIFIGFTGNKNDYTDLKNQQFERDYKVEFSKEHNLDFESENKILSKASNFIVAFKGYGVDDSLEDRLALRFITREIYKNFDKKSGDFGAYEADYKNRTSKNYGLVWFSVNSYSNSDTGIDADGKILDTFFDSVDEVLNDSDLQKELEKFKAEQIKGIEEDWNDFYDRYDSIIYDILEIGRVVDLEESVGAVKGLDVGRVLRVAGEVFDAGKAFVLRG